MKTQQAVRLAKEFQKRVSLELGEETEVILFGSHARDEAAEESDIDLLVLLPKIDNMAL
jgi:predicted nucleotidyltransferase